MASFLLLPVGMSVFSILMTLVPACIARQAGRAGASREAAAAAAT